MSSPSATISILVDRRELSHNNAVAEVVTDTLLSPDRHPLYVGCRHSRDIADSRRKCSLVPNRHQTPNFIAVDHLGDTR